MTTPKPLPARASDVVIVDATGMAPTQAYALRRELVAHGLRVKLDIIPLPTDSPPPGEMFKDASDALYCVLLMPGKEGKVAFLAIPAPSKPGQVPVLGRAGSPAALGAIEMGDLAADVGSLADRVARRARARR